MTALTADRGTPNRAGSELSLPVAAGASIVAGALVAVVTSGTGVGNATKGATAANLRGLGVAIEVANNSAGAAGDVRVKVRKGVWLMNNSAAGDQITLADIEADCFIVDDQTVAKTSNSAARSVAGKVHDVDAGGVWVRF